MKTIIVLLLALTLGVMTNAQDKKSTFTLEQTYVDFVTGASDSVSNYDTLWTAEINVSKGWDQDYNVLLSLDHVSGTPVMTAKLYGKVFDEDAWTALKTFNHLAAVDTVIQWSESTNKRYRLYKVETEENGTAKTLIEDLKFKIWSN